jgi:hypothetical protein
MKQGTPSNPKTKALARRLQIPIPYAVGLLDMLWEFTRTYARAGDVGRFSDSELADAMGWPMERNVSELIDALVSTPGQRGFLDRSETHRLIVHDWSEHADRAVHQWLLVRHETFADGWQPFARTPKRRARKSADDDTPGFQFGSEESDPSLDEEGLKEETSGADKQTSEISVSCARNGDSAEPHARAWSAPSPASVSVPASVTPAKAVSASGSTLPSQNPVENTPPPGKAANNGHGTPPRSHGFESAGRALARSELAERYTPGQREEARKWLLGYSEAVNRSREWGAVDDTLAAIVLDAFGGCIDAAAEYLRDHSQALRMRHRKPGDGWGWLVKVLRDDRAAINAWLTQRSREPPHADVGHGESSQVMAGSEIRGEF